MSSLRPQTRTSALALLQLNIEGLTTAKVDILERIAIKNHVTVIILQETHVENKNILKVPGYTLAGHIASKHHGIATFVRKGMAWSAAGQSPEGAAIEWLSTKVHDITIINIYKPPPSRLVPSSLPDTPAPAVYAGDFNSHHIDWGYSKSNSDGDVLVNWASTVDATLLYDPKEPCTFYSARWNSTTNPDLAFVKWNTQPLPVRCTLDIFPRSHHRPSLITIPSMVQATQGKNVKRWNFRKANWAGFTKQVSEAAASLPPPCSNNLNDAYDSYCKMLLAAAKNNIPRGVRKAYVPCWDKECEILLRAHTESLTSEDRDKAADNLFRSLTEKRRQRWTETVESINFTHSSRRGWQILNKLTGRSTTPAQCPVTANSIASLLLSNGRSPNADKDFARQTSVRVHELLRAPGCDSNLSNNFTTQELELVIQRLKTGKAPGIDGIHSEYMKHQGKKATDWLCSFLSACLRYLKLPKIWRCAKVIALPKPNKPSEDPKGYRPISLLCVPYKLLERLILARLTPVIDPQLPKEQAGFRSGRSTTDQVTLLCHDIEESFQAGEKAGAVFLDLTAAYDTVWLRGLHMKLLDTIPDKHMVSFIMEMLSNRSFRLHTSNGQSSRMRRLRNGVPQGSVLAPMLFNIYIHDLPVTTSRKYSYADDLAILFSNRSWEAVEEGLSKDMEILCAYLKNWRLKLSVDKTVTTMFHLYNKDATRKINIMADNVQLHFEPFPTYLGVKLDRTLSFKRHLDCVKAKTTARAALIRRLAGTTWGADTKTLRISTEALVFATAEYCAPAWCRSPHVKKLDAALNTALRTISGCLRATPIYQLPVLAGIAPAEVRREAAMLVLARKAQTSEFHLLHKTTIETTQRMRLKSRRPFATHAQDLLRTTPADISKASWMRARWKDQWKAAGPSRLHQFIKDPTDVPGQHLTRREWTTLNRLRTGVGRFGAVMQKWGLTDSAHCECGDPSQTLEHVMSTCPKFRPPNGIQGLIDLDNETLDWLAATELRV